MEPESTPSLLVDLFGDPIVARATKTARGTTGNAEAPKSKVQIAAVNPSEKLRELAAKLPTNVLLGTSSWSYPGWDGLVYDGAYSEAKIAREGLQAYASHPLMRTVGIDRTFYGPIAERDYQHYARQVPEHFRFLIKAPMAITSSYVRSDEHAFSDSPYFLDADYAINEFIAPCTAGLGAKTGPIVFQFPPQGREHTRHVDAWIDRLYRFLRKLPPGFLYAVEIRDRELMTPRFFMCLKTAGIRFCVSGHAKMCSPSEQIEAMDQVLDPGALVVRWNLHWGFKYETAKARYEPFNKLVDPDPDGRAAITAACLQTTASGHPAFIVVGNKAEGCAPLTIEALAAHIVSPSR
jgi:uncharacterized protein YecE (DUF72 family)